MSERAIMIFWEYIENARELIADGNLVAAGEVVDSAEATLQSESFGQEQKLTFLEQFKCLNGLREPETDGGAITLVPEVRDDANIDLDIYVVKPANGVSLVTCCMNRNENLVKALPSWIACKDINEIIIVDWSSNEPVREYLASHQFTDPRIKVIRVDNQPRWILSYAFNVGFRAASYNKILKTDADIIIYPEFFTKNKLRENTFIAGDWRIAEKGQEHINGFFFVYREKLQNIKAFNEYITTYGWDDDDIYSRMVDSGLARKHVDVKTIYHIPHDDALRIGNLAIAKDQINYLNELHNTPKFKIFTNKHIANIMPVWNKDRLFLPFRIVENSDGYLRLVQSGQSIHYVPAHIRDQAEYLAEVELTSWVAGLRAFDLDKPELRLLLKAKPQHEVTILDVELTAYNHQRNKFKYWSNYVLIYIHPDAIKKEGSRIAQFMKRLSTSLNKLEYGLVIQSDAERDVKPILDACEQIAFIPGWRNIGNLSKFNIDEVSAECLIESNQTIIINTDSVDYDKYDYAIFQATSLNPNRDKFYIDAQHGLGNRLRAIGSAAAIANATGKQLVIVWEPDHHCECRFSDLFDYDGEVIEKSFVERAKEDGDLFNYMEIEEGAEKDKPIKVSPTKYTYARAAYTLVHEASHWDAENAFIKQLKPSKQVLDLIEPFNVDGYIAAHIRMEAGKGLDHNTYDSVENWTQEGHDQLHYWREKSHYSAFIKRIDQLINEDENIKLFVATDLQETYDIFQQYYGDRLVYLKRNVFDRSKEQIIYAMADVLLLSKCKKLLGSTWSSFSEAAMRLSDTYSEIEMSGRDF